MKSLFLEGLKSALDIVETDGVDALKALIREHEIGRLETTAVQPKLEKR